MRLVRDHAIVAGPGRAHGSAARQEKSDRGAETKEEAGKWLHSGDWKERILRVLSMATPPMATPRLRVRIPRESLLGHDPGREHDAGSHRRKTPGAFIQPAFEILGNIR